MNEKPIINFYKDYIKAKAHIAHKSLQIVGKKQSHPSSVNFLLGRRNKHVIVNPIQINDSFLTCLQVISFFCKENKKKIGKEGASSLRLKEIKKAQGSLLIVNTNPEYALLIENFISFIKSKHSNSFPVYYCNEKWVGGLLTNWKQVYKSVQTFIKFSDRFSHFIFKNNINFPRYKKMTQSFRGLYSPVKTKTNTSLCAARDKKLRILLAQPGSRLKASTTDNPYWRSYGITHHRERYDTPDLIFLINPNENRHVVEEAVSLNIPVIAITDSNTNLSGIPYPLPGNSNSILFVYYCLQWIIRIIEKSQ